MSDWFQVRIVEGDGVHLRVPIAARARSVGRAYERLGELRAAGVHDARLGVFEPTHRDGSDGRWWLMPRALT